MRIFRLLIAALFLAIPVHLTAQDAAELPTPQRVELTTPDNISLIGDFYAVPDAAAPLPTVLLLHGVTLNRHEWVNLLPALLEGGFNVLTVDQRGHGESGGDRDLVAATGDVQLWFDWLREQPTVKTDAIAAIGSSWGTVTATAGCAADPRCYTVISMSPGDFPTLTQELFDSLSDRSILFIVGRQDTVLFDTKKLFARTSGEAAMQIYNSGAHGTDFFSSRNSLKPRVITLIITWLNEHLPAE